MRRTYRERAGGLCVGAVLVLCGTCAAAAEGPVYQAVKAELVRPRGGLPNVLAKLTAGGEVRIAYFGGSITAQAGWRVKTLKWFQETWPKARLVEINAAIGGTGSSLGVFRVGQDVLAHKPDLVFVEFAVNDGGADPRTIWRAMEGIVRQVWRADPKTDICYVYTIHTAGMPKDYLQGNCPRSTSAMEMLADHYGTPSINVGLRIVQLHEAGTLVYKPDTDPATGKPLPVPEGKVCFANDDCHPRDEGHEVYTKLIAEAIGKMSGLGKPGPHSLGRPFVADNWEQAKIVPLKPSMVSAGWKRLPADQGLGKRFGRFMPELWEATTPGERIAFRFRGSMVQLYDLVGPDGAQAVCTVDGKASRPRPRFDRYCTGHRIATLPVAGGLDAGQVHTVQVEIHPEQPDRSIVTDREKAKPSFDPKRYDGTAMRVGGVMLIGDLVD
ncbi:MAG TPA: SGNH/GDSL hydrolase family protein [Phycisphaerae bacterium]|nr:SGNH/GDSL hydrolase family protein [Phycisphaerae bacterium]